MNKRGLQIGPGAASLLLIAVVLSMSVISILNLVSARNDLRLSERSVAVTETVYRLNSAAERHLAELEAAGENIPETPFTADGDEVRWEENDESGRVLRCAVRRAADGHYEWIEHRLLTAVDAGEEDFFE